MVGNIDLICESIFENNQMIVQDAKSSTLIILDGNTLDKDALKGINCNINQEVYFFNQGNIIETYTINNNQIIQKIGKINQNQEFEWTENTSFIQRRSYFHGVNLKVMVEEEGIWNIINNTYQTKATFHTNNKTFEVADYVSGITIDLIKIMQSKLNFTTSYYLREDRQWGKMILHANGTLEGIGIVGDIHFNRADIFGAMPSMNSNRAQFLAFLYPNTFTGEKAPKYLNKS